MAGGPKAPPPTLTEKVIDCGACVKARDAFCGRHNAMIDGGGEKASANQPTKAGEVFLCVRLSGKYSWQMSHKSSQ